jgi:hypothetical protein
MRIVLIIAALVVATTSAHAWTPERDRIERRFENDIRANNESMSRRFSGRGYSIDTQNKALRERLNSTKDSAPLRSR